LWLSAQPKGDLQQRYLSYLRDRGYEPYIDQDGDVQFRDQGLTYYLRIDAEDPSFLRLVLPNFWPIESEVEYEHARRACGEINRQVKAVKVYLQSNNVWLTVENFMASPESLPTYFDRCLDAAQFGVRAFRVEMQR
jgi:hypothetical protein